MKIIPLAFESFGTRGMCTWIDTGDARILVDPGVNLAPMRFGLPPHPIELERKKEHWASIEAFARQSDVLIVTHYHFDHINPEGLHVFRGKVALVKHPHRNINHNQEQRAEEIIPVLQSAATELHYADGKEFRFGNTHLLFSPAVHHGTHPRVCTIQVALSDGDSTLVHTSDVVGAELAEHVEFILQRRPEIVIVDGPNFSLKRPATDGIVEIITRTDVRTVVVDHHLLRDERWKAQMAQVYRVAESKSVRVLSAAEFMGKENDLLEARRPRLYTEHPIESQKESPECH